MPSKASSKMLPAVARMSRFWQRNSQRKSLFTAPQVSPIRESLPLGAVFESDSGRTYKIEEIIQDRGKPLLSVYRASGEGGKYLVKHTQPDDFGYQTDLQKQLSSSPNIRTYIDTARERELCIYPYLAGHLLRVAQKELSKDTRRNILRMALTGLIDMHEKGIIHNGKLYIKPNNILVDYEEDAGGRTNIKKVQLSDLDDMVVVPPGKWLLGPVCGNQLWRSPEVWCGAARNQTSDVFSFGAVMIYVMVKKMVFWFPTEQLEAEDSWRPILRRHMSFFSDLESFEGFLDHIGEENPFADRFIELFHSFVDGEARSPVYQWQFLDPEFRDLLSKMMVMDPKRRISAKEALQHPWWNQAL